MKIIPRFVGPVAFAAILSVTPMLVHAGNAQTTSDEIRAEVSETMEAIGDYSVQERDEALTKVRDALERLDDEIELGEQALRENWSKMSDSARENARDGLRDLREARNKLGERFGALQSGTRSAWEDLKAGFSKSWSAFSDVWKD